MIKNKTRIVIKKVICLICVITVFMNNSERIYAMETMEELKEQIAVKMEGVNIREYEMNIVLDSLCIKRWRFPSSAVDEIDRPVDEPLGQYTEERFKEYTEENFQVEFEYCCGYYGAAKEPLMIQIEKIYKDEKLYFFTYNAWFIYGTGALLELGDSYCLDKADYHKRVEEFYENME